MQETGLSQLVATEDGDLSSLMNRKKGALKDYTRVFTSSQSCCLKKECSPFEKEELFMFEGGELGVRFCSCLSYFLLHFFSLIFFFLLSELKCWTADGMKDGSMIHWL